ncbi:4Fe-4S binding protein [Clostridia bacterium OttesenSCG-928-F22]|nr:4Fe-4S binding protein [Clostridia bacterium OttesenSCG-928-F22]
MKEYFHSVRLYREKCKGCTNCIKKCLTEAIRVRNGKAQIIPERCIDCGECIRVCPHHAKVAVTDHISRLSRYRYTIALPAPSLYAQFKKAENIESILSGLIGLGFDHVFEVALGAEVVSRIIRKEIETLPKPVISSACPAILRLIQVRFPDLLDHIVNVDSPMEAAAYISKKEFSQKHGVPMEDIGAFFITPCAAKMTAIRNPLGNKKSFVDGAFSIVDIYAELNQNIKKGETPMQFDSATPIGIGWALSGGETTAVKNKNALFVDGIQNVLEVLEQIENGRLSDLDFLEGLCCPGGCVGGPLVVENPFIGRTKIQRLMEKVQPAEDINERVEEMSASYNLRLSEPLLPREVMKLDEDMSVAMKKIQDIEEIAKRLPGLDCSSCGSPSCMALAEDIVKGEAKELDCIFRLKEQLQGLAEDLVSIASWDNPFSK